MTTEVRARRGHGPRPSAGRLGALAGVTPIGMFGVWTAISGWGGATGGLVLALAEVGLAAVVAGWIVGGRMGRSIGGHVVGLAAYGFVGWLVLVPLGLVGSLVNDIHAGRVSDPPGILAAAAEYLLYGAVSGLYAIVLLLPFGAGWIATVVLLRRAVDR